MKKSEEVSVSMTHENGQPATDVKGNKDTTDNHGIAGPLDGGALFVLESKGKYATHSNSFLPYYLQKLGLTMLIMISLTQISNLSKLGNSKYYQHMM